MCHIPAAVASSKPLRVDHAPAQGHSLPRVPESAEAIADAPDGETCYALSACPLVKCPSLSSQELRAWSLIATGPGSSSLSCVLTATALSRIFLALVARRTTVDTHIASLHGARRHPAYRRKRTVAQSARDVDTLTSAIAPEDGRTQA